MTAPALRRSTQGLSGGGEGLPRPLRQPLYPEKVVANFWRRVEQTEGCWLWTGYVHRKGYGQLSYADVDGRNATVAAHRFAYELGVGPLPEGLQVDHLCRVRRCVRPSHLEAVTPQENVKRAGPWISLSHFHGRKTHCLRGHPLAADNLIVWPDGRRACRKCRNALRAARRRRRGPT